jgi:hypothetical protein
MTQDGNLFWEIAVTDTPEWPEPDRWVETVCLFLQLLAWERTMLSKTSKFYSTVRLQIMRDLCTRKWQASAGRPRARRRMPRAPPGASHRLFPPKLAPPSHSSQEHSRGLGHELFALYFPEELTASTPAAQRAATEKLSAYEQERNRQVRRRLTQCVSHCAAIYF